MCSSYLFLQASSLKGEKHKEETYYRIIFVIGFWHTGIISRFYLTQNHSQSFPIPQVSSAFVHLSILFLDFDSFSLPLLLIFLPLFLTDPSSKIQSI